MMTMKQFVLVWLLVVSLVVSTRGFAATAKTGDGLAESSSAELQKPGDQDEELPETLIGDTPGWYPLGLGLSPAIQYPFCEDRVYGVNLSFFGVDHDAVLGADFSLLGFGKRENYFAYDTVCGLQCGVVGCSSEDVYGMQVGGLGACAGDVFGVQLSAGISMAAHAGFCGQVGALLTYAYELNGVQIGGFNFGKDVTGAQIGIFNGGVVVVDSNERIMPSHKGAQIGLYNTVNDVSGAQVGAVNAGEVVDGVQIGLANGGGNVNGLQVGLVNGKVGSGTCVQIGVLNIAHKAIRMPLLNVSLD